MVTLSPEARAAVIESALPLVREAEGVVARIAKDIETYWDIRKRLDGAAAYLGDNPFTIPLLPFDTESNPGVIREEGARVVASEAPRTWRDFGLKVLEGTERGYSTSELMKRAEEIGLGDWARRYRQSQNGYLAAVRIAEAGGEIVRKDGVTYLREVWKKIEAGELEDIRPGKTPGGIAGAVLAAIEQIGPASPAQVIEALKRNPDTRVLATTRPNGVYTNLSKLLGKELLVREDSVYRLPSQPAPVGQNVALFPKPAGGANM